MPLDNVKPTTESNLERRKRELEQLGTGEDQPRRSAPRVIEPPSYAGDDEGSDPAYMRGERYRRQFRRGD